MAERLLTLSLRTRVGDLADELYISHGAGTGAWHEGEPMNPPAAQELLRRGGDSTNFTARRLSRAMLDVSDLILCATSEQVTAVLRLRPAVEEKTFVLGEFGRLLPRVDQSVLPPAGRTPAEAHGRGIALVAAVDALRGGGAVWGSDGQSRVRPRRADNLDDPWGLEQSQYARVADEIEHTVVPLAAALTGVNVPRPA